MYTVSTYRHRPRLEDLSFADKTEFLICGTSQQHAKVLADNLGVSGTNIPASQCIKNLGVIIDEDLILYDHIASSATLAITM